MVCCRLVVVGRIPSTASVFNAELYAISLALDHIEAEQSSNCTIYTDLLSSLLALELLHIGSHPVLANIQNQLAHFSLTSTPIQFFWILSHIGPVPVPYMDYGPIFKAWLRASWQLTWSE
ncbi:uncharacterized protein LOC143251140 isoform X1 [Tachypleus tridentatus]|uniref:uncharacterized protein LOC143251140 isoform X1 n=1 Tax=Tachypleus tridentatus TaxID=6853 RepID=UPI003FD419BF